MSDNNETDDQPFSQRKLERSFSRSLSRYKTAAAFAAGVTRIIKRLGYSDYSFIGLSSADNPSGRTALISRILLTSYGGQAGQCGSVMFQAVADSLRNRHLSMLYLFIASLRVDNELTGAGKERYLMIADAGGARYYLAPCGVPALRGRVSVDLCGNAGRDVEKTTPQINELHPLDILAGVVEAAAKETLPAILRDAENSGRRKLTARPKRLLNTIAHRDVSLREAADILCLSTNTVDKHMAAAKSALGTKTIAGTLWSAAKQGVIEDESC
ncbi:hypothetical protein FKG94_27300 [Exilibacterium tricleocarpae]|uniref:Uncharacterized protein n=1 Tax=Exilibacterium tricleocarpae TaxID=2591008 RepID=A0A545SMR6_9GAMM|nr:hypothetical protein [Exilibacterium tricleocarpae]TQV66302.1 hypothetical protein FKG94_27300 [Exilibacterium tricleocarpae]